MSQADSKFPNFERAQLGIVFGVTGFIQFKFGGGLSSLIDHKPLKYLRTKQIPNGISKNHEIDNSDDGFRLRIKYTLRHSIFPVLML